MAGLVAALSLANAANSATLGVSTWEKVAAIFTAVGGIAAMFGAIAAWRAARASSQAAQDAKDALAASLKPQVQLIVNQFIGEGDAVEARAVVRGPLSPVGLVGVLPATDVAIQFNLTSGRQDSASMPILEPSASRFGREPPYLNVVIGQPSQEWPPPDGDHATVTVSYSDVRKVARYQQTQTVDLHRAAGPASGRGLVSFRNVEEGAEVRTS
jgi:hypothetical protein